LTAQSFRGYRHNLDFNQILIFFVTPWCMPIAIDVQTSNCWI
jgi:hypothetical protein